MNGFPTGLLNAKTVPWYIDQVRRRTDSNGLEDHQIADVLSALDRARLLRDPAEPTLAEIREKVEAWKAEAAAELREALGLNRDGAPWRGKFVAYDAVLALLEPRKPVRHLPLYVTDDNSQDGAVRPALPHEIDAAYHALHERNTA